MRISFVIPCYRSEMTLLNVVREIETTMNDLQEDSYEVILVNDSSPDKTMEVIRNICRDNSRIIGVDLARNFGQHSALMAGMSYTSGDVVVFLDDDGQTPASEVGKLLEKIEEGYDVVYARYSHKMHNGFRNFGSRVNSLMVEKLLDKPKDLYISSYFAARRFVVDEILQYKNAFPYVIGLVLRSTNKICNVDVEHRERQSGASGYTLKKLLNLWVNGFTAFSVKPLRVATYSGVAVAFFGFCYLIYTIVHRIVNPIAPMGWSSTMAMILIIGGSLLFVLGMIGEYIGRIYICINNSPQFVIREVVNTGADSLLIREQP